MATLRVATITLGVVRCPSTLPVRLKLALALLLAILAALIAAANAGPYRDFAIATGAGASMMLLALSVASRWPKLYGGIPGLLGGMVASALGEGWRYWPSWGGFIGGIMTVLGWVVLGWVVLGWVVLGRTVPYDGSDETM